MQVQLTEKDVFALYRLPSQKDHYLVQQNDKRVHLPFQSKNEFLFHPFQSNKRSPAFSIRADLVIKNARIKFTCNSNLALQSTRKDSYLNSARDFIQSTRKNHEKLVLSRILVVERKQEDLFDLFLKMCRRYKNAFIYLFNHPKTGSWMGASPETLLSGRDDSWSTMALAGTRMSDKDGKVVNAWKIKEEREQNLVTEFIEKILIKRSATYTKMGPYDHKAGQIIHLRTDFKFKMDSGEIQDLINELHPTPAVCGIPRKSALDYILEEESHRREYYCGFLGPLGIDKQTQLFVNLRCMKLSKRQFVLYLGGGITSDSNAEDEWLETQNKARTMLDILELDQ